jgi:hypothetical protein
MFKFQVAVFSPALLRRDRSRISRGQMKSRDAKAFPRKPSEIDGLRSSECMDAGKSSKRSDAIVCVTEYSMNNYSRKHECLMCSFSLSICA